MVRAQNNGSIGLGNLLSQDEQNKSYSGDPIKKVFMWWFGVMIFLINKVTK